MNGVGLVILLLACSSVSLLVDQFLNFRQQSCTVILTLLIRVGFSYILIWDRIGENLEENLRLKRGSDDLFLGSDPTFLMVFVRLLLTELTRTQTLPPSSIFSGCCCSYSSTLLKSSAIASRGRPSSTSIEVPSDSSTFSVPRVGESLVPSTVGTSASGIPLGT